MIRCICLQCLSKFDKPKCWVKRGEGRFCSRNCQGLFRSIHFKHTKETKVKIGKSTKGKKHNQSTKDKISYALKGRKVSSETRNKQSIIRKGKYIGELHPNWKGGLTPIHQKVRNSQEYADWRKSVFDRDSYTCQECKKTNVYLNADHIKPFSLYPELRLVLENGRTLCVGCHKKTDTYAGRIRKYQNV